jgi:putative transposase
MRTILPAGSRKAQSRTPSPDPEYVLKKGDRRGPRRPRGGRSLLADHFYYADEFNPNYHTGETVVLIRRRKRCPEVAELLEALLEKHPRGRVYVTWDNSNTHEDDEVEAVLRGAAGRLVLLYLPTYSPWLNPIEMLWRHFRREVTHCELFSTIKALISAAYDFFERYNRCPWRVLSIID